MCVACNKAIYRLIKTGQTQARAELAAAQSATVAQLAATQAAADVVAVDN